MWLFVCPSDSLKLSRVSRPKIVLIVLIDKWPAIYYTGAHSCGSPRLDRQRCIFICEAWSRKIDLQWVYFRGREREPPRKWLFVTRAVQADRFRSDFNPNIYWPIFDATASRLRAVTRNKYEHLVCAVFRCAASTDVSRVAASGRAPGGGGLSPRPLRRAARTVLVGRLCWRGGYQRVFREPRLWLYLRIDC